jgi:hypothetical protein
MTSSLKEFVIYTFSISMSASFPLYELIKSSNYKGLLLFVPSILTSIFVQTEKDNRLIKIIDIVASLVVGYLGVMNMMTYPIIKLNHFILPFATLLVYFVSIISKNRYYFHNELCHHLMNLSLYLSF